MSREDDDSEASDSDTSFEDLAEEHIKTLKVNSDEPLIQHEPQKKSAKLVLYLSEK
jgi:hypothetical protein